MSKSIISNEKECFICKENENLSDIQIHKHHIFYGTANRKISEKQGCWVYLCSYHHNMSNEGVHFNWCFDIMLKKYCQYVWEQEKGTRDEFRKLFGKSYI